MHIIDDERQKAGFLKIGKPDSSAFENAIKTARKRRNMEGFIASTAEFGQYSPPAALGWLACGVVDGGSSSATGRIIAAGSSTVRR